MNEQQLQQILTIQQAITAAATAAMINTLLNPQQAAVNLVNQNALTESPQSTPNADFQDQQDMHDRQTTPTSNLSDNNNNHHHHHHHHHQNQHNQHQRQQDNHVAASIAAAAASASASATSSNMMISQATNQSPNNHNNKKLKRHNQAPQAFSRQHNSPSSSSAFLPNNVGLPRKLVRGQDVWLGRGAEQTRQILKCMWCNQSFRTLAEMTQHMKITQHYTNIISQEQITSWKQPEGSETIPSGRQQSKQSISSKNLDEFHENTSASEKSIDSEREDFFSNDEEPTPPPPPPKRQHRAKSRPERTTTSNNNADNKNSNSNTNDNATTTATTPTTATNDDNDNENDDENDSNNNNNTESTEQQPTDLDTNDDQETNDENKCKRESTSCDESQDNDDDCDKKMANNKKRPREDDLDADVNTNNIDLSVKQDPDAPKDGTGGTGDPLSALETMVEKSFDPRMRPGMASGGILQRLGIDEEVCPPWQHINYANWYAAAAYGHPMAAALLAAGINLQNGIKLSKNMAPKKNDD